MKRLALLMIVAVCLVSCKSVGIEESKAVQSAMEGMSGIRTNDKIKSCETCGQKKVPTELWDSFDLAVKAHGRAIEEVEK